MLDAVAEAGLSMDPNASVNFYVALKSNPLTLLAGPSQSGKIALVQCLAKALIGQDSAQCQIMPAHAWWANKRSNVAMFTEAQTHLNTSKILAQIGEAWLPENPGRIFMACHTRMSAAELEGHFASTALQIPCGGLMPLPTAHFTEPIPFPPNLLLIGTIDADG